MKKLALIGLFTGGSRITYFCDKIPGLNYPQIAEFFSPLSSSEKEELEKGDFVWLKDEPSVLVGKVSSFSLIEITEIIRVENDTKIFHKSGSFLLSEKPLFWVIEDREDELVDFVRDNPQTQQY